jgi:hypothetical protein
MKRLRENGRHAIVACAIGVTATLADVRPALAQVARVPGPTSARWEIEGAAGLGVGSLTNGTTALPGPGAPIATSTPIFPSRQTTSWLFGDGAAILNGVNAAFGLSPRVTPLDSALTSLGLDSTGVAVSFRARRIMTRRFALEFSLDFLTQASALSNDLVAAASTSASTANAALTALITSGPFNNAAVASSSSTSGGASREIATTGALVWRFRADTRWSPYATFGGGALTGLGNLPSVTVDDSYHFLILNTAPIAEADHVVLRYDRDTALVAVLGGGLRHVFSDRWGFSVDGRVFLGGHTPRLLLDASPSVTTGTPAGFVESFTNPAIQFSNNASTGRLSTLSGAPIQGFEAVSAGRETRVLITVGVFRRF